MGRRPSRSAKAPAWKGLPPTKPLREPVHTLKDLLPQVMMRRPIAKAASFNRIFGHVPTSLITVVSWAGGGPTRPMASLLMHLALHEAGRGNKVLFACHRPVVDYARLCLSQASVVACDRIALGHLDAGEKRRLEKARKALPSSRLLLWDARSADPAQFNGEVRSQVGLGADLLIVDNLRDLGYEWKQQDPAAWASALAHEHAIGVVAGLELPPPFKDEPWGAIRPRLSDLPEDVLHNADVVVTLHPKVFRPVHQVQETLVLETIQDPIGGQARMELQYHRPSGRIAL